LVTINSQILSQGKLKIKATVVDFYYHTNISVFIRPQNLSSYNDTGIVLSVSSFLIYLQM